MSKEKFNSLEWKVFNLIREGKSRSEIATSGITTASNFNAVLAGIYEKTDDMVGYHSARSKFTELQGYLRNNPNAFSPVPDKVMEFTDTPPYVPLEMNNFTQESSEPKTKRPDVRGIIEKLNNAYKTALEVNKAKLSVLADIEKEIEEGLKNA